MKLLIDAISIAAIALMLTPVHIGSAMAQSDTIQSDTVQSDTVKCPPPPPPGHPNIFMPTVQCSNLRAQQPIIENKPPPVSGDGTKPLPKEFSDMKKARICPA